MFRRNHVLSLAFVLFATAVPLAATPPDHANNRKTVTVMTRNLYVGADLTPVIDAAMSPDPGALIAAVSGLWGIVQFTDFPARAAGLAREVETAQPDLIGLQEAELWRSQTPADFIPGNAGHVEFDFVRLLLDALSERGLHYAVIAEEIGADVEFPGFLSLQNFDDGLLSDIRLTDREVILARTDLKVSELKLSNPQTGHFAHNVEYPVGGAVLTVLRGWASVDAKIRGKSFRFVTTHLEADDPGIRDEQAMEMILGPTNTPLPVVLVADINSNANGDATSTAYQDFIRAGFVDAWFEAHPAVLVSSCCNAPDLTNPSFPFPGDDEGRIDQIFYRGTGDFDVLGAALLGTQPSDRVSNGLTLIWPSDHAGVAAKLQIRN